MLEYLGPNHIYSCYDNIKSTQFTYLMFICSSDCDESLKNNYSLSELDKLQINNVNSLGWSALAIACGYSKNNDNLIKMLLDAGANINLQTNDGYTPLFISTCINSEKRTEMLIKAGADLNKQVNDGWTTLMHCCRLGKGREKIIKMLIDAGANLNIAKDNGSTALIVASANSKYASSEETVEMLIKAGVDLNKQDNNGWTALMYASGNSKNW
jgi:ankyrin repeat protein